MENNGELIVGVVTLLVLTARKLTHEEDEEMLADLHSQLTEVLTDWLEAAGTRRELEGQLETEAE